jgi:hypothetical protein
MDENWPSTSVPYSNRDLWGPPWTNYRQYLVPRDLFLTACFVPLNASHFILRDNLANYWEELQKSLLPISAAISDAGTMAPEPTHVLLAVSTVSAAIFLLILPLRLWDLRNSSISRTSTRQGLFKAVSIPALQDPGSTSHNNNDLRLLGYCYRPYWPHIT